jgi:3-deoxy-D-manno-octulosonic-acid transferase
MLVNARLSEKSRAGYAKLPTLSSATLRGLRAIAAQSQGDADRLTALGAHPPSVVGNIKFDIDPPENQITLGKNLRAQIGQRQVFLAASTREGEEALLLDAWTRKSPVGADVASRLGTAEPLRRHEAVLRENPASPPLLIIVPRHPQRFEDVAALIQAKGLRMQRRSENAPIDTRTEVLLGDSMGEMFAWHTLADVAFIGGSLLDFGSQNLIEACAVGTPVLLGKSTYNFAEAALEAKACGAALAIVDADDLVQKALLLLQDATALARMSEAGLRFTQQHRGATARTMVLIARTVT